uniref:Uncharacterized protein n=1 Tax=Romanomermis culicivorax TaxID=13658 RepID=A0A915K9J4_ROMCU
MLEFGFLSSSGIRNLFHIKIYKENNYYTSMEVRCFDEKTSCYSKSPCILCEGFMAYTGKKYGFKFCTRTTNVASSSTNKLIKNVQTTGRKSTNRRLLPKHDPKSMLKLIIGSTNGQLKARCNQQRLSSLPPLIDTETFALYDENQNLPAESSSSGSSPEIIAISNPKKAIETKLIEERISKLISANEALLQRTSMDKVLFSKTSKSSERNI